MAVETCARDNVRKLEEHRIETYKTGVDDCIQKPASPSLFQTKAQVWLRHFESLSGDNLNPLKVRTPHLFPSERIVMLKSGGMVSLGNMEPGRLLYSTNRPGQIVTIDELDQRMWGYTAEADNTMRKNEAYLLQRKIENDSTNPLIIQIIVDAGYKPAEE
jgi:DNA-binding response OmpR family regulator